MSTVIKGTFPKRIEVVLGPFWSSTPQGHTNDLREGDIVCLEFASYTGDTLTYTETGSLTPDSSDNRFAVRMEVRKGRRQLEVCYEAGSKGTDYSDRFMDVLLPNTVNSFDTIWTANKTTIGTVPYYACKNYTTTFAFNSAKALEGNTFLPVPRISDRSIAACNFTVNPPTITNQCTAGGTYRFKDVWLGNELYPSGGWNSMFSALVEGCPIVAFISEATYDLSGLILGGQSTVVSSSWTHVASGGLELDSGIIVEDASAWSHIASGGLTIGGDATELQGQYFWTAGENAPNLNKIVLIGSAQLTTVHAEGGLTLGGSAVVPVEATSVGGITTGIVTSADAELILSQSSSGGLTIAGAAITSLVISDYSVTAAGGLILGGEVSFSSSVYTYIATGRLNGFFDDFDRADNTNIGSQWNEVVGNWEIKNNRLFLKDFDVSDLRYNVKSRSEDVSNYSVQCNFSTTVNGLHGVIARYTNTDNWYGLFLDYSTNTLRLIKNVSGTTTELTSASTGALSLNTEYTIKVELFNSSIKGFFGTATANPQSVDFSVLLETNDTDHTTSGSAGVVYSPEAVA